MTTTREPAVNLPQRTLIPLGFHPSSAYTDSEAVGILRKNLEFLQQLFDESTHILMITQKILPPLTADKAQLLVEGVRSLNLEYVDNGIGWCGYVDWFAVADKIGMHWKRAEQTAGKFEKWGLQTSRNNYDGWISPLGIEVAILLDPALSAPIVRK